MADEDRMKTIDTLLNAKGIIVIIGAGVSAAAGIPTFRGLGSESLADHQSLQGKDIKDVMSADIKTDIELRSIHCKFIAEFARKSVLAKPTAFHRLLRLLDTAGTLKRLYTQNIDGLECKVGFDTLSSSQNPRCVTLHGSVENLRCDKCSLTRPLQNYIHILDSGDLPDCPVTRRTVPSLRKRDTCGLLFPDVVLYNANVPDSDHIITAIKSDLKRMTNSSSKYFILVVGTTLLIPGVQNMLKSFSATAVKKGGDVVYMDIESKLPKSLEEQFTMRLQIDCEEFARDVIIKMENRDTKAVKSNEKNVLEAEAERREDMRPLWDWI